MGSLLPKGEIRLTDRPFYGSELAERIMKFLESYPVPEAVPLLVRWRARPHYLNLAEMIEFMESLAPEGYYFGPREGNPSEWGFWRDGQER